MAALICTKAGHRSRLIYRIRLDRGPAKGRRNGFTETDYARRQTWTFAVPPAGDCRAPRSNRCNHSR
ncbi:hypothetical protein OHS81_29400 [Streptomyces sp. NBC_00400]